MRPLVTSTPLTENEKFEDIVQPHLPDLRRYCLSLAGTWDGEDLMQETLTKAYRRWMQRPNPIAKSYLFRIAYHLLIDGSRKQQLSEDMNQDLSQFEIEDTTISEELMEAIEILLHEFSPKQRVVMLLIEGFGYTTRETADRLGESEGSVKAALHRARRKRAKMSDRPPVIHTDEVELLTYVSALRNGNPDRFIDLYWKELATPLMSVNRWQSSTSTSHKGISYLLVMITKKRGGGLLIPFYHHRETDRYPNDFSIAV